ncbi:MAG: acyl carrier protein [Candidatus Omnitrophota bacterium]
MTLFEEIREIISEQLEIKPEIIKPGASFIDLGITLSDAIELVLETGEMLGVEIPDEDAEKMGTVGDLVGYLENKIENIV